MQLKKWGKIKLIDRYPKLLDFHSLKLSFFLKPYYFFTNKSYSKLNSSIWDSYKRLCYALKFLLYLELFQSYLLYLMISLKLLNYLRGIMVACTYIKLIRCKALYRILRK